MKLHNIPFSPPDISDAEIDSISQTMKSGWLTTGPRTKEFEKRIAHFCNTDRAVCLNSATACMEMALRLLGVGEGDEVIVPAYTYTATAAVSQHVGAKLVMIDSQKDCVEMDYDKMSAAITERTKVIMPVDIAGIMADYDKVFEIVESKKALFHPSNEVQKAFGRIVVIADGAHSFGASRKGKKSGEAADFTSFSFHAVKNLTTAEGGALVWKTPFDSNCIVPKNLSNEAISWNDWFYKRTQLLSLHGQNKDALAKTKLGGWEYDIIGPWYKCNMTDIMASIGLIQLDRYPELLKRRREIIEAYDKGLKDCCTTVLTHYSDNHSSSGHLYLVRINGRTREEVNHIIEAMAEMGIATNVHYKPLPMMTAYRQLGFDIKDYPAAYALFENEITLPLHTKLSNEDIERIVNSLRSLL